MLIEKMTENHIDDISELENLSMKSPWSRNMFLEELKVNVAKYFVVTNEKKAVAYMGMHCVSCEGHITNIAVHPDFRRQGIASRLIRYFIDIAIKNSFEFLTLEVRESNLPAIECYKKLGFKEVGLRKKYYENKENAIIMTLFLNDDLDSDKGGN